MFLYESRDEAKKRRGECACGALPGTPTATVEFRGRVVLAGSAGSLPPLRVSLRTPDNKKALSTGLTTPRGEFVVAVTEIPRPKSEGLVVVEDARGAALAKKRIRFEQKAEMIVLPVTKSRLAKAKPVAVERVAAPLLVSSQLEHQARVIQELFEGVGGGDAALAVYKGALRPLFWLGDFYQDAAAVLEGDPAAIRRWRTGLLGVSNRESFDKDFLDVRLATSPGEIFHADAFSLLVAATVWAARDPQDEQRLFQGLATAILPQFLFDQVAALVGQKNMPALRALLLAPAMTRYFYSFSLDAPSLGGDIPGLGGKIPNFGGDLEGWPRDYWKPRWIDHPGLAKLGVLLPGRPETCFDFGKEAAARLRNRSPRYLIQALSNPHACPGEILSISGTGFGMSGGVLFPAGIARGFVTRWVEATIGIWSDTYITLIVPPDAMPGPLRLRVFVGWVEMCGIDMPVYRAGESLVDFEGGLPAVSLGISGAPNFIEPGEPLILTWSVNNATTFRIRRTSTTGPLCDITNPMGNSFNLGPFTETIPVDATYELTASNRCGMVTATVTARLRCFPQLVIEGIEVTQGIQVFWRPGVTWNSLATIANKDTIVRVYVSADLGGFMNNQVQNVTGTLTVGGVTLTPINGITPTNSAGNPFITVGLRGNIDRTNTDHTLNFRIPAALANGTRGLLVGVRAPEVDVFTPTASQELTWTWQNENPLRVRYVRISDGRAAPLGTGTLPTDAEALFTVQRAFDLLPSPPTDIAPARMVTRNTSRDFSQDGGLGQLLNDLDDDHNCSSWEWLWAWTGATECPDEDHALWVGLTTPPNRGLANRPGNTCIVALYTVAMGQTGSGGPGGPGAPPRRTTPAHELSHNLGFMHVNLSCRGSAPAGPFYVHPTGGILADVPFDPFWNQALSGTVNDYMSYGCTVWTSEDSWARLQVAI